MHAFNRGPAPELLKTYGPEITADYVAKKTANSKHQFHWPKKEDRSVYSETRDELRRLTDGRCSYCGGYPVDEMGEEQVDHFKPKTIPAFFELVCTWNNLYLVCVGCNKAKLAVWEPALLRPDGSDFKFERYFEYRTDSGKIVPNEKASLEDQHRAARTIEILNLNRPGLRKGRKRTAAVLENCRPEEVADWGYAFLVQLCRPAQT